MKVLQDAVGGHDPRVLEGSDPERGIRWELGTEIVVTDELASKFEASGMAMRIEDSKKPVDEGKGPESAMLATPETAVQPNTRRRQRA